MAKDPNEELIAKLLESKTWSKYDHIANIIKNREDAGKSGDYVNDIWDKYPSTSKYDHYKNYEYKYKRYAEEISNIPRNEEISAERHALLLEHEQMLDLIEGDELLAEEWQRFKAFMKLRVDASEMKKIKDK